MRQDDSELVVEAVEQQPEVGIDSRTISVAGRIRPAGV
jgi:hypothetical protein